MGQVLETYRRLRGFIDAGDIDRLSEVMDEDLVENCLGLTGWTLGLDCATANLAAGYGTAFADFGDSLVDSVEADGALTVHGRAQATHVGAFLGVEASGRRVAWDYVDLLRTGPDGRFNWRLYATDWNYVRLQMLDQTPDLPTEPQRRAVQAELAAHRN
ncbi:ester cyclase [Actinomadura fibrosa]|uniref:Ester cyclase n=1 Tax=Actinomadura fibrosa TaxID=111802 RepID=A0ABW2XQ53_9ACTN|nr:ester cyclase [Actinomadura fibrosa]